MKSQITTETEKDECKSKVCENLDYKESYKTCPYCGQAEIPFKKGICFCGKQVGSIQYVRNPQKFAKNYYSYVGTSEVQKLRQRN